MPLPGPIPRQFHPPCADSDRAPSNWAAASALPRAYLRQDDRKPCADFFAATRLVLASLGWDVCATDIEPVVSAVLRPNIAHNASGAQKIIGDVQVRELDWTVAPSAWCWSDSLRIASSASSADGPGCYAKRELAGGGEEAAPLFDLIITSDTLYSPSLVVPLLRTLHRLCVLSQSNEESSPKKPSKPPPVYMALENRDPALVASFLTQARDDWGFSTTRIPDRRVGRAIERCKMAWKRSDWEGVEVWKLLLTDAVVHAGQDDVQACKP